MSKVIGTGVGLMLGAALGYGLLKATGSQYSECLQAAITKRSQRTGAIIGGLKAVGLVPEDMASVGPLARQDCDEQHPVLSLLNSGMGWPLLGALGLAGGAVGYLAGGK